MDSAKHPGLGALADHILSNGLVGDERRAWTFILNQLEPYPDKMVPALKPPKRRELARRIVVVELVTSGTVYEGTPRPMTLTIHDGSALAHVDLPDGADGALALATALFTHRHRGALLVLLDGAASGFAVILRTYARQLVALGFTVEPLTGGATIRAVLVRKDRHTWCICDLGIMAGMEGVELEAFAKAFTPGYAPSSEPTAVAFRALRGWQATSVEHFGAAASVTVGRSAIRAASRHLGDSQWLWRAHPITVAMMRAGGAYRGGYAAAHRYVGQAWRMDMNKAYSWALGEPLPLRMGLYRQHGTADPPPGVYMARVSGSSGIPLYLGAWDSGTKQFGRIMWAGGDTLAVITVTEGSAIRRLGYSVTYGTGMAYLDTFTLRGFTAQIAGITRIYGRGSPQERIARAYGNTVYGKLAERPERDQTMYAATSPGTGWLPFVTNTGDEIADLWTARSIAHRPHQHVDVASEVTALVRARLYDAMGAVFDAGGLVPHADTDGFLATIDPAALFTFDATAPGQWRPAEGPERAIVWGAKGYAFGADVRTAGLRGVTQSMAERVIAGDSVELAMKQRSAPFGDAPLYVPLRRAVRAG